jgi:hypothetical protein
LHKLASKYNGKRGYVVLNDVNRMILAKKIFFHEATTSQKKYKNITKTAIICLIDDFVMKLDE